MKTTPKQVKKIAAKKAGRPKKVAPIVSEVILPVDAEVAKTDVISDKKEVYILGSFPNPTWVRGSDKEGNRIIVRVPLKLKGKLIGKTITVEKIDGEGESYYKYAP